jgi:K+-sensing histidine kinase KdpD
MRNKTLKAIESSIVKDKTVLTFSDNGIGIDLKIKIKVFGLYQRFHDYPDSKGLGLYLVKSQIEAMEEQLVLQV